MKTSHAPSFPLWVVLAASAFLAAYSTWADEPANQGVATVNETPAADELKVLFLPLRAMPGKEPRRDDTLLREISRQAFLMAARDELHLPTRDGALREPLPPDTETAKMPFNFAFAVPTPAGVTSDYKHAKIFILRTDVKKVVLEREYELDSDRFMEQLVERCEDLSRTDFLPLLAANRPSEARLAENDPALPDDIERQLAEMEFIGQFAAVRTLNRLMRAHGESARRQGALVRGYANLGLLTSCFVAPAHKAFLARSLLYAERLCARDRASPWALWHRAYARALAGLHAAAIEDMTAADKLAADEKVPRPDWVELIEAFCRFDEAKLSEAAERVQLAAVLRLRSLAFARRYSVSLSVAQELLEDCPDCYLAIDSIYELGSLGTCRMAADYGPQAASEWLIKRLSAIGGPAALMAQMAEPPAKGRGRNKLADETRIKLIRGLRAAGDVGADQGEPSWSVLAALVEDVTFLHAMRLTDFYADMLDVPIDDMLSDLRPLLADHPLRHFIDAQTKDLERRREAVKKIRESPVVPSLVEDNLMALAGPVQSVDRDLFVSLNSLSFPRNDRVFYDLLRMGARYGSSPNIKTYLARALRTVSPHAPTTVAMRIAYDWDEAEQQAAEWEKRYATSPEVLAALGARYQQLKRFDDAERCLKQSVEAAPDTAAYQRLAEFYWRKGDVEAWKAAIDGALTQPSYGLEHARMRVNVANYYIGRKDYDAALPYAQEAAQTGAAWAMFCEANCWEGKQEWERAERLIRMIGQRYADIPLDWIYFCKRTGKGDVKAATRVAEQFIARAERKQVNADPFFLGGAYIMVGQPEKALPLFKESFKNTHNPSPGILAALLADQLMDVSVRDQLLSDVLAKGEEFKLETTGEPRKELLRLTQWLVDDLKKGGPGELDLTGVDALFAIADESERLIGEHLLGRYLLLHGKRDKAIDYWKRGMASPMLTNWHRTLCGTCLTELGIGPEDYQQELSSKSPALKGEDAKKQ